MQPDPATQPLALRQLLSQMQLGDDGSCSYAFTNVEQSAEMEMREYVASSSNGQLLEKVARYHARELLGDVVNQSIFLIHGDATELNFPDGVFDGYWSVHYETVNVIDVDQCEILYQPDLHISFPGREDSWTGRVDALLSNDFGILGFLAS